jgi:hypothetical protein
MEVEQLRTVALDCDVDPDAAVAAARSLAEEKGADLGFVADVLAEQFAAGVGLDGAVSAFRPEDPAP